MNSERPLLVLALGGNALSPPAPAAAGYGAEREIVAATGKRLDALSSRGYRLLIVHGNGPQVGRLLDADPGISNLDIHVAQTQGELGYLLAAAMDDEAVCLLTRVEVSAEPAPAVKPVGPWLSAAPADDAPALHSDKGWRLLVPSPRPRRVLETGTIAELLRSRHTIAAGGGGIAVDAGGAPVAGVIDKDWTASLLALELNAAELVFATDVDGVYADYGTRRQRLLPELSPDDAERMIAAGGAPAGSMAPKLEGALSFARHTARAARICHLRDIDAALAGTAGSRLSV